MDELRTEIFQWFIEGGLPFLAAFITALLGRWLNTKHTKDRSALHGSLMDRALEIAGVVVYRLEHSIVPLIREAAKDGKISEDEKANLQDQALDELKSLFGPDGWRQWSRSVEKPDERAHSLIQASLQKMRHDGDTKELEAPDKDTTP